MCPVRLFYPQLRILCFRPRSPCGKKLPELRHTGMLGCLMPPPEGIHFLRTPAETACVDSNPDKHRPHLAGNADRCIRGWNGEKYRLGRKCGDEIMSFSLISLENPNGLSPRQKESYGESRGCVPLSPKPTARCFLSFF